MKFKRFNDLKEESGLWETSRSLNCLIILFPAVKKVKTKIICWPASPPPSPAAHRWTSGFLRPLKKTWPPAGSEPSVSSAERRPQRPLLPAASAPERGLRRWSWGCRAPSPCCPGPERSGPSCRGRSTAAGGRPAPPEGTKLCRPQTETGFFDGNRTPFSFWGNILPSYGLTKALTGGRKAALRQQFDYWHVSCENRRFRPDWAPTSDLQQLCSQGSLNLHPGGRGSEGKRCFEDWNIQF